MNKRIGLTWPSALPVAIYSQILQSEDPETECRVPVATIGQETGEASFASRWPRTPDAKTVQPRLTIPSRKSQAYHCPNINYLFAHTPTGRIFPNIRPFPGAIFLLRRTWWDNRVSAHAATRPSRSACFQASAAISLSLPSILNDLQTIVIPLPSHSSSISPTRPLARNKSAVGSRTASTAAGTCAS